MEGWGLEGWGLGLAEQKMAKFQTCGHLSGKMVAGHFASHFFWPFPVSDPFPACSTGTTTTNRITADYFDIAEFVLAHRVLEFMRPKVP